MDFKVRMAAVGLAALGISLSAESLRSVWDGVYTPDQAEQGQALYQDNCASCHGDTLIGQDVASALAGSEFLSNWNGLTVDVLFERIRTTMPQNKVGSLNGEKTAAILAFIFSANGFPVGKTALPQQAEVLKAIRIDASKPEKK